MFFWSHNIYIKYMLVIKITYIIEAPLNNKLH